jgi:hypothetical protein
MRKINNGGWFNLIEKNITKRLDKSIAGTSYVSHDEAMEFKLSRYYEGMVCKNGHRSERSTANRQCCECSILNATKPDRQAKKNQYYLANRSHLISLGVERQRERYNESPEYKAAVSARNMLKRVLRKGKREKHGGSYEMLGYDRDQLMDHMSSLFTEGMSWDNYGEWHIDHIVPVSLMFEYGVTEPNLVNALDNLQPLWAEDNLKKSNKCFG